MKKIAIILAATALFTSCQKEADLTDPNNPSTGGGTGTGTNPTTGLLVRTVEVSGTDSNAVNYAYDAAGRLARMDASDNTGTLLTYKLTRNATGIITKTVAISPDLTAIGIDSIVTNVFYNAANSRYTYARRDIDLGGIPYTDSTVYAYDASGNITSATSYAKISLTPYAPSNRTDYTYANGNVTTQKTYDYDAAMSTWNLDETSTFAYDAKVNALKIGVEGVLLGLTTAVSNNNNTVFDYTDATDPTNNLKHTSTFTYNAANKPSGGTMAETPSGVNYTLRFYYN